jgi:hypothetical protein
MVHSSSTYVAPQVWTFAVIAGGLAHLFYIGTWRLQTWVRQPALTPLLLLLGVCVGGYLLVASASAKAVNVPSLSAEESADTPLISSSPVSGCVRQAIATEQPPILRDSLVADVHCQRGATVAHLRVFRTGYLLNVYAAIERNTHRHVHEAGPAACPESVATYAGEWGSVTSGGEFLCYGAGKSAHVEWSEQTALKYSIVASPGRAALGRWWLRRIK